jgi:hypothetical protein
MKGTYPVTIPGFENQKIEAKVPYIFTGHKLLVNGQPAPVGGNRGEMLLRRDDGREVIATWHLRFLGLDVPNLIVDGQEIQVLEPLKWYEFTWICLPILLVFFGGGIGILCGLAGFILNAHIFRSSITKYLKYVMTAIVTILSVGIWYLLGRVIGAILLA